MKRLNFIQIEKNNDEHYEMAENLWLPFIQEVNAHDGVSETDEEIICDLRRRINIQGNRQDMHFEIALNKGEPIGVSMFAIDTGTVYGLLERGYGTIMGFYIIPQYRRQGYGSEFYKHIENILKKDGAPKIYMTPDEVTGEPFWNSLGFINSGKIDPDDKKFIYIKECTDETIKLNHKISFVPIRTDNSDVFADFMHSYVKELDEHSDDITPEDFLEKWIKSIISIQGDSDRHLEYCCADDKPIGFIYGKIDHPEHKGYKKVGYGYIMEFYVIPEYRLKGYGKQMFRHLEMLFFKDGAKHMYLTSDPVTGKPFWEKMGFIITGEKSPENNLDIYEKDI